MTDMNELTPSQQINEAFALNIKEYFPNNNDLLEFCKKNICIAVDGCMYVDKSNKYKTQKNIISLIINNILSDIRRETLFYEESRDGVKMLLNFNELNNYINKKLNSIKNLKIM